MTFRRIDKEPQVEFFVIDKLQRGTLPKYMAEGEHPMMDAIQVRFKRVQVGSMIINRSPDRIHDAGWNLNQELTETEMNAIDDFRRRPEIEWVLQNSFDGLHIKKEIHPRDVLTIKLTFTSYMEPVHENFWRLKYSGQQEEFY